MNRKASIESQEMAPLEQNEKHLECDGNFYKIVKEEPKPHEINHYPIAASRSAFIRALKRHMGIKQKKGKKDECHALKAGINAATEEIMAEERYLRKDGADQEFLSKIKTAVNNRCELKSVKKKRRHMIQVSFIK